MDRCDGSTLIPVAEDRDRELRCITASYRLARWVSSGFKRNPASKYRVPTDQERYIMSNFDLYMNACTRAYTLVHIYVTSHILPHTNAKVNNKISLGILFNW